MKYQPPVGRFVKAFTSIVVALLLVLFNSGITSALSAKQREVFDRGIFEFDLDVGCGTDDPVPDYLPGNVPEIWRDVLTKAATSRDTSANLLAAIYLTENGNEWRPFDHPWATSSSGAMGPFQFLPGTWEGHQADGDEDGEMDVNNVWDAAFAAADMVADMGVTSTWPLGTLEAPMTRNTLLYAAVAYNAGPGDAQRMPADITLEGITEFIKTNHPERSVPEQASEYAMNVHAVVSSAFTKSGKPGYGDPRAADGVEAGDAATPEPGQQGPLIVLDPGHSGEARSITDPQTGLIDFDYPNHPELEDMFDVAKLVETDLLSSGYRVIMTKQNADDTVGLRARADIANANSADLAVSIHDQAGENGGLSFNSSNNFVYEQVVGRYRTNQSGTNITFDLPDVAEKSQRYAQIFATERTKAEGHTVTIDEASINRGPSFSPGNIWMTQLFSQVPWIYNEAGGNSEGQVGLNDADKQKYATGIINSIKVAIPADGSGFCAGAAGRNAMVQRALLLAHDTRGHDGPSYGGKYRELSKLEYQTGLPEARGDVSFQYWDGDEAYSDCGVFVATVVLSTGVDPDYPDRGTYNQMPYLRSGQTKWDVYDDYTTDDLIPGDVLIFDGAGSAGHTYMYVGPQNGPDGEPGTGDDFNSVSASFHDHVPQAANAYMDQQGYHFSVARLR